MKTTINVTKIEGCSTELLEEGLTAILKELARRSIRTADAITDRYIQMDTMFPPAVQAYKDRHAGFNAILQLVGKLPTRVTYME